jgi:hypothetical protein
VSVAWTAVGAAVVDVVDAEVVDVWWATVDVVASAATDDGESVDSVPEHAVTTMAITPTSTTRRSTWVTSLFCVGFLPT